MKRHAVLKQIHRAYQPTSYLEIGINTGRSLALSRAATIAVDPAFKITSELHCDVQLVRATSDEFFARRDALAHLPDSRVDLAFIDGKHLFEFALRDFINVERHAHWASVIAIDDVLPRTIVEASRERGGLAAWAGDVFKLPEVLTRFRPDLLLLVLDAEPTGVLLVLGADPQNNVLRERYDQLVGEYVYDDPQRMPDAVLRRETAIDAASIASSDLWSHLREARESGAERDVGWERVRRSAHDAARPAERSDPTNVHGRSRSAQARRSAARAGGPRGSRALAALRRRVRRRRRGH